MIPKNLICFFTTLTLFLGILDGKCADKIDSDIKKSQYESFFAINGSKAIHIPDELNTTVQKRFNWMKELGLKWDRSDLWWHLVEPEKGKFDFTITDKVVKTHIDNGVQIYPILSYGAKWWPSNKTAPVNDKEIAEYGNYVSKMVDHYKDKITYWSVWNEPNIETFWKPSPDAEMYAKTLKAAYTAAKKADPDCKICSPVVAPLSVFDRKFVERLYQVGCKDYFDVFDYHYYRHFPPEDEVPDEIDEIKAMMHRYGDKKEIWISESGVSSPVDKKPASYERQAMLVVRNQILAISCGVRRFFYFDLQNWYDAPDKSWDSYLGLVEAGDTKKPSFYAYKTMLSQIDYTKPIGRYSGFGNKIEAALFYNEKADDYILAVWYTEEGKNISIKVTGENNKLDVVGIYGEATTLDSINKEYNLEISNAPIYIHNVNPDIYLSEAGIKFDYNMIEIFPGDRQSLELLIDSKINSPSVSVKNIDLPAGIKWSLESKYIECGEQASPGLKEVNVVFDMKFKDKNGKYVSKELKRIVKVKIGEEFKLALRPYMKDGKLIVDSVISNLSNKAKKENIYIKEIKNRKEKIIAEVKDVDVAPITIKHLDIDIDNSVLSQYENETEWILEYGKFRSQPFRIYATRMINEKIIVDGKNDEWKNKPSFIIDKKEMITRGKEGWKPAEASAEVKFLFSKDNIFLCANIKDDDPLVNKNKETELWKGDSFEIYLGFDGPTKRTSINKNVEFQIGVTGTYKEEKPIVFQYHLDKIIKDAVVAAEKTSDGYIIEASIPVKSLGDFVIRNNMLIGFDAALDDLDRDDWAPQDVQPGRALMWGSCDMNWIDPSGWSMLIIK